MKKYMHLVIIFLQVTLLTGCATVQKKFTRKKKEPEHKASVIYLDEGPYQKKYSNAYYYKSHYSLWKTWHSEMSEDLGSNTKKLRRASSEARGEMKGMLHYLVPDKQKELEPYSTELEKLVARLDSQSMSKSDEKNMRVDFERIERIVSSNFYYDKVKDSVLPDTVDAGGK